MKRVTAAQMRRLDEIAIRDYSIPSLLLMENAGRSVCDVISREYRPCRVVIVVGKGNNGGDGLVVSRHLYNRGYEIDVVLLEDPSKLKADPLLNFSIMRDMKIPWTQADKMGAEAEVFARCQSADLVVDAIFGIGIKGPVCGIFESAIRAINKSGKPVVSIDIPSGLDGDTGWVDSVAVKAAWTVALAWPKAGVFSNDGPRYAGKIETVDIGLPRELLESCGK